MDWVSWGNFCLALVGIIISLLFYRQAKGTPLLRSNYLYSVGLFLLMAVLLLLRALKVI
jgi:hypothetical protein